MVGEGGGWIVSTGKVAGRVAGEVIDTGTAVAVSVGDAAGVLVVGRLQARFAASKAVIRRKERKCLDIFIKTLTDKIGFLRIR
jgi:hypothetical protein